MGGSVHTVKENAEALVVATKEIGLEANADKKKYMFMSRDRNAGRGHSVKINNTSIERVEEFKYLGTTITDQNSIQEEIKSRLKSGNACYHSNKIKYVHSSETSTTFTKYPPAWWIICKGCKCVG